MWNQFTPNHDEEIEQSFAEIAMPEHVRERIVGMAKKEAVHEELKSPLSWAHVAIAAFGALTFGEAIMSKDRLRGEHVKDFAIEAATFLSLTAAMQWLLRDDYRDHFAQQYKASEERVSGWGDLPELTKEQIANDLQLVGVATGVATATITNIARGKLEQVDDATVQGVLDAMETHIPNADFTVPAGAAVAAMALTCYTLGKHWEREAVDDVNALREEFSHVKQLEANREAGEQAVER